MKIYLNGDVEGRTEIADRLAAGDFRDKSLAQYKDWPIVPLALEFLVAMPLC